MRNTINNNLATNYHIYLKNEGADDKVFWLFLSKPEGVVGEAIFANSSAMLNVTPNYPGINEFIIPLQYSVAAGAQNRPVELGTQIRASMVQKAQLKQIWNAKYETVPPRQGPRLDLDQGGESKENTIQIVTNNFNKVINENDGWYSNQSFGIETENGFTGVSWAPSPGDQSTLTPKFKFYIATGSFTSNQLVDINTISRESATVELSNFEKLRATVTLTQNGRWKVESGGPNS